MRLILNVILSFLCTTLFSSDNGLIYQFNEPLPKEIFPQVIKNIVPNFLSPTHPEEIIEVDKQLVPYKAVCKTWKKWLDRNVNFRDMEKLFVGNYFWPPKKFVKLYSERFKQKWYHPDQVFQDDEQRLVDCYQNACEAIDTIKLHNSPCNSNDSCTILIHNNFYTPFYDLLLNNQLSLWYNLFTDAIKYYGPEYYKKICVIFAQQYLKYCQTNNKITLIEEVCVRHFSSDVIEIALESLDNASKKSPFDYCNCASALSLEPISDGFCMMYKYIQQEGFLTHKIYGLLPRLFLSQEKKIQELRIQHYKEVEEIKGVCDLNVLLPYILVYYIEELQHHYQITQEKLFTPEKTGIRINYLMLLNNFYQRYLGHKKSYHCNTNKKLVAFFKKYQSYFTQKDEKERSFVYCLLLVTFDKPIAMELLSAFIQGVDQNHEIFSVDERVKYIALFNENFLCHIDHLEETESKSLVTYFNPPAPDTSSLDDDDEQILQPNLVEKSDTICVVS